MTEDRTARWDARYRDGTLPWDTGKPDRHLLDLVHARPVAPCRVLEVAQRSTQEGDIKPPPGR